MAASADSLIRIVGLYFSLFLSSTIFSIDIPNLSEPVPELASDFGQLENEMEIEISRSGIEGAEGKIYELAQRYLYFHRLQEAAWTLRRGQFIEDAIQVEDALRDFLIHAPIKGLDHSLRGKTKKLFLELPGDIKIICKEWPEALTSIPDPRMEIVAYEMAQLLSFDIVPMTVKRKIGNKWFSVQYFISQLRLANRSLNGNQPIPLGDSEIHALDLVIGDWDRHGHNWGYRPGKKRISPDHDNSKVGAALSIRLQEQDQGGILQRIASQTANIDRIAIETRMKRSGAELTSEEITKLYRSVEALKDWFVKHGFEATKASPPVSRIAPSIPPFKPQEAPVDLGRFWYVLRVIAKEFSETEKEKAVREMVRIWANPISRAQILPIAVRDKEMARIFIIYKDRFPEDAVVAYQKELRRLRRPPFAVTRALKACKEVLSKVRISVKSH